MKIKHKITSALFILFLLILGLGGVGGLYINLLSKNSGEIIKDNYRTLQYITEMDNALDVIQYGVATEDSNNVEQSKAAMFKLRGNLEQQQRNITERGEAKLTAELAHNIEQLLKVAPTGNRSLSLELIRTIKLELNHLHHMNEDALLAKNQEVQSRADKVVLYMITISACFLVIALIVLFTFPNLITQPIHQFTDSIKQIAEGKYKVRVALTQNDEFGEMAKSFNKMGRKLQEYEQSSYLSLLEERNRLDAVINQLTEGIIGLDVSKKVLFANKRIFKLLNLRPDQLIGKHAPDVAVNNELLKSLIQELMIPFEEWEEHKYKALTITEERKEKLFAKDVVNIMQKPIGEDKESLSGYVVLLTDVTEFSEREKAKTAFMSTLSHELKTPVAAIEMGAELLRNEKLGTLSDEQREWLQTIDDNNQRIKQSINEVLDLSKIERGLIEMNRAAENPEITIDKAIKAVQPFANEKGLSIEVQLDRPLPDIMIDPHKITWVLNNILINAIRYTPEKGAIMVKTAKSNQHVYIRILDEGPGISKHQQELIFEPFKRVSGDKTDGLGLGLAISKEFVEAMGGQIGVISKDGEGSEFWVKLVISS